VERLSPFHPNPESAAVLYTLYIAIQYPIIKGNDEGWMNGSKIRLSYSKWKEMKEIRLKINLTILFFLGKNELPFTI